MTASKAAAGEGAVVRHPVPDVVAPPPGNPRFPLFDGLRAIAAILVLLSHSIFSGGYDAHGLLRNWTDILDVGVTVFFLISGFLLYRPYVSADLDGRKPTPLLTFYRRRLLRIVPAYWLALTVLSLWPAYNAVTFEHWPRYYLFLQVYFPYEGGGIGQAWSLCVEMTFYLLLPLYAWLMRGVQRRHGPLRRLRTEFAALGLLSVASAVVMWDYAWNGQNAWNAGLPRFLFWFALGMLIAIVSAWARRPRANPVRFARAVADHPGACWLIALGIFIFNGAITDINAYGWRAGPADEAYLWVLGPLAAFFLLLPAAFVEERGGLPGRVLGNRVLVWLGLISYGIFLWHLNPIQYLFGRSMHEQFFLLSHPYPFVRAIGYTAAALLFSIPVAALSYYLVEKPFLKLKFSKRKPGGQCPGQDSNLRPTP